MLMATMSRHTEQREPSWDEVLRVFSARKNDEAPVRYVPRVLGEPKTARRLDPGPGG